MMVMKRLLMTYVSKTPVGQACRILHVEHSCRILHVEHYVKGWTCQRRWSQGMIEHQDPRECTTQLSYEKSLRLRWRKCSHDKNTMVVVVMVVMEVETARILWWVSIIKQMVVCLRWMEGSERRGRCGGNLCKSKFITHSLQWDVVWCGVMWIQYHKPASKIMSAISALGLDYLSSTWS